MDTTDPEITFDENGICNHCRYFDEAIMPNWHPNEDGLRQLGKIIERIKKECHKREYDCIIGLSGGADSSYMALKMYELFKIRPLVVHVDAGWNCEVAVQNIEKLVKYCGWDLHTHVMNWEDMKQLQLAYLKSGISNQDVPQDHAFFASLYHFAVENKIKYILSGGNIATESIFPKSWHYTAMDSRNLKAIFKRFGKGRLKEYKTISFWQYYFYYPFIKKMKVIRPLNFMPYNKKDAMKELMDKIGWKPYGLKHGESVFTRFFQNYFLVERFGYDKRKPHLSSMILSGQMTREEALQELAKPLYDKRQLEEDKAYICKKLDLTETEFEEMLNAPKREATDFPSHARLHNIIKSTQSFMQRVLKRRIVNYS
jgi:N-acetyl sugar amidotransferase